MRSARLLGLLSALSVGLLAACDGDAEPTAGQPPALPALALVPALGGARFDRPVEVGAYPAGRVFVAEQPGRVVVLQPDGSDELELMDISELVDVERGEGLLSVALDPAFEGNGHLWAYYFAAGDPPRSALARFEVVGDAVDVANRLVVLELAQPGFNQNGGAIRFGPDGMLYLSLGDGSASTDPFENGQNLGTLLGAVVRIDVRAASAEEPYAIPDNNPFVDRAGARGEIWAFGLRNPWRMAFDPETGELWAGDVGFTDAEEVNRVERGANLGWNMLEGFECLSPLRACERAGKTSPVAAYAHDAGRCAVTGGIVYRGEAIPALRGAYVYGDFCSGEIFALRPAGGEEPAASERSEPTALATGAGSIVSFGNDSIGEVYVVDYGGAIWRLVAE